MTIACTCSCTCAATLDQSGLPDSAVLYPGAGADWDKIPLGINREGEQVSWDVHATPHMLVLGRGAGKGVAQRVVLEHAALFSEQWAVVGVDPTGIDVPWNAGGRPGMDMFTFDQCAAGIAAVHDEMLRRFDEEDQDAKALLVVVNEVDVLVRSEKVAEQIMSIARLGRGARVHLHVSSNDPLRLPTQFLPNFDVRVAHTALTQPEAQEIFGNNQATALAEVLGRSLVGVRGRTEPFQAYWVQAVQDRQP